jgi:hypothetical protein
MLESQLLGRQIWEDHSLKPDFSNKLKKNKLGMVPPTCNPCYVEGGSRKIMI